MIGNIVDGDERRVQARAELGEKSETARLVAAMIMHAGEERAARRRVGERREPLGEYLQPSPGGGGSAAKRPGWGDQWSRCITPTRRCTAHGRLRMTASKQRPRRQGDEHLPFARGENLFEGEMAFALLGFEIALGQEPAETSVGWAIRGIGQNLEAIDRHQTRADDELEVFSFLPFVIGAHHAGEAVAVGDADGGKAEFVGGRDHLLRMRSAAQEGKVGGHRQFGIGVHFPPPLWGRVGWGVGR